MSEEFKRESDLIKSVQQLDVRIQKNEEVERKKEELRTRGGDMSFMDKRNNPIIIRRSMEREFRKFGNV